MNEQRKIIEFVFYLVLFLISIGLLFHNAAKSKGTPSPMPDPVILQTPPPVGTPRANGEAPPLLPQNIPSWELD
jgi:hypothetical protein